MTPNLMITNNNNNNNNENGVSLTPIQEFYSGSTIFITGATGFMGKCLIEKLLRSCPDLGKIYILVREKRGKKIAGRVEEMFQDVLFSKLKASSEKLCSKIIPIAGDVSQPGLGLSLHDRALLQKEVEIVFHGAATVNFNEKLRVALAVNLNGTKEVLDLCKGMERLKSVVHVSTVYSNCHLPRINEKFYTYPISYKDVPSLIEKLDDKAIEELTPRILGDWPNTYTFTKAMAEALIKDMQGSLPLSVFRPGVVVSTWKEPIAGWIDNIYGPTGICAGAMMGVLGTLWVDDRLKANLVPVDYTTNALIACAWETGNVNNGAEVAGEQIDYVADVVETELDTMYQTPNVKYDLINEIDHRVFNYVSACECPITWAEFCGLNIIYGLNYPLPNAVWYLNFSTTRSSVAHTFYMIFLHLIPALFGDGLALMLGKKPRLLKIYKQTNKFANILSFFTTTEFQFTNDNTQRLWRTLDSRDQKLFPFSMSDMNWLDFFRIYVPGIRKYLCKEDEITIAASLQRQTRIQIFAVCLRFFVCYVIVSVLLYIFKALCNF